MNIGILGFSFSGKSTLYAAFMGGGSNSSKSNIGIVSVPDEMLDKLSNLFKPKSKVYASVQFEDTYALDTSTKAEKVKLLERMKVMDAYVIVLNGYNFSGNNGLVEEFLKVKTELIIDDLDFVLKRLERIEKEKKDRAEKEKEVEFLKKLQGYLEEQKFIPSLNADTFDTQERLLLRTYNLITLKPMCYVINIGEGISDVIIEEIKAIDSNASVLVINALLEAEIASMEGEEKKEFLTEYNIAELGINKVIRTAFELLDLITFFTVGEDECRSWNIPNDSSAVDAAGAIHSDLARGFIRAEVMDSKDLLVLGSLNEAKKVGKLRLEGKTYKVKDGDIVHIMFNI